MSILLLLDVPHSPLLFSGAMHMIWLCCHADPPASSVASSVASQPMILLMSSGTPYWEPEECTNISPEPTPLTPQEIREAHLPLDLLANQSSILWDFPFLQLEGEAAAASKANNLAQYYSNVAPISGQVRYSNRSALMLLAVVWWLLFVWMVCMVWYGICLCGWMDGWMDGWIT